MNPPVRIRWHQEEGFRQDMPDDEWLGIVGPRYWIVLSQDRKFHVVDAEAAAIKQHVIKCFYLPCASDDRWISLCCFVRRYEKMQKLAAATNGPFIYELKRNGQFYMVKIP